MAATDPIISAAVEGIIDESVIRRLAGDEGILIDAVYGKSGKRALVDRLKGYNSAAKFHPWVVLIDMDHDADCAPPLRRKWVARPTPGLQLRIVVREIEAWLLGDAERFASYFSVPRAAIPLHPELLDNPKEQLVAIARRSRRSDIREDMVPGPHSGRTVGPAYASRVIAFATDTQCGWRPPSAAKSCDSLRRCVMRLKELATASRRGR